MVGRVDEEAAPAPDRKPDEELPRRTQAERTAQAERALLAAARALFAARGVDQTSLADVGQLAGYSRGLAHHHFGSKAALVERLATQIQARFVEDFRASGTDHSRADRTELLAELVGDYLVATAADVDSCRAFFVMWGGAIPAEAALRPIFAAGDAHFRTGIEDILRAGIADGSVDDGIDPVSCAVTVAGMVRGVATQYLIAPEAFDMAAAAQTCREFIRKVCAPTRSTTA